MHMLKAACTVAEASCSGVPVTLQLRCLSCKSKTALPITSTRMSKQMKASQTAQKPL